MNVVNEKKVFIMNLILIFISIVVITSSILFPRITLIGKRTVIINYKEKYKEPGFKASIMGKDLTNQVITVNNVNSKKIGIYKVKYVVSHNGVKSKTYRKIIVRDISRPKIKLLGKNIRYICPNSTYYDEGYKAFDNYDKDITDRVVVKENNNEIMYTVEDSSNNVTTVKRKIVHKDRVKPQINLEKNVFINIGDEFKNNYHVSDNCNVILNKNVEVIGDVDTSNSGTYDIEYKVKDKSGNEISAKQIVHVSKKNSKGTIYLTFDDGPKMGTTDVILDILKEEGVQATFFITNSGDDSLVKREYDEGHSVGIHTATHNYSIVYSSVESYYNDLKIVQDRIERITGNKSMIVRFPGGSSNTVSRKYSPGIMSYLTEDLLSRGYRYFDWNITSGDAGDVTSPKGVYENVINNLSHDRVNVILMHDIKTYTRDALRNIINYAKENGYTFSKITDDTEMIRQKVNN